jgi:hypothetical protein
MSEEQKVEILVNVLLIVTLSLMLIILVNR